MKKTIDKSYKKLLKDILNNGQIKNDRTGTGTISVFGRQIHHEFKNGFPILTTKNVYWKGVVGELLWFLKGETNIKYLLENNINIWTGDAYKKYKNDGGELSVDEFRDKIISDTDFSGKHGELGPIYGFQWRNGVDQINNLIKELVINPDSRRLLVNSWNVLDLEKMTLPPCHYSFQCYTSLNKKGERELSLLFNMRSWDVFLGGPFNLASYGLLMVILGKLTGYKPKQLICSSADTHLYLNHLEAVTEFFQTNESNIIPYIEFGDDIDFSNGLDGFLNTANINNIYIRNYKPTKKISAPLSN